MFIGHFARVYNQQRRATVLIVGALVVVAGLVFAFKVSHKMPDFEVYWRAGHRALAAEPLYRTEDSHWVFKYLPAFAIVAIAIVLLPLSVAKAIWFFVSVVTLGVLLPMSMQLLPELKKPRWLLIGASVVALGKFYGHELVLGQVNLFVAAAATAAFLALKARRDVVAAVLIVIAIVLKPHAAILLPWLLVRGNRRSVAIATIGMFIVLALPVARYGLATTAQLNVDWLNTAIASTRPSLLNIDDVSWAAMYTRWLGFGTAATSLTVATTVLAVALVAWMCVAGRQVEFPAGLEGSVLLVLMPLISPQGWDYVLLLATPAVMYLVNYEDQLSPPTRIVTIIALALVGLTIYDVVGRRAYFGFMRVSGITLCFFVIIGALAMLRQRHIA
jgi:hypothetical protein